MSVGLLQQAMKNGALQSLGGIVRNLKSSKAAPGFWNAFFAISGLMSFQSFQRNVQPSNQFETAQNATDHFRRVIECVFFHNGSENVIGVWYVRSMFGSESLCGTALAQRNANSYSDSSHYGNSDQNRSRKHVVMRIKKKKARPKPRRSCPTVVDRCQKVSGHAWCPG